MNAYEIPLMQFSLPAVTNVDRYRFVSVSAEGNAITANATSPVIGVSRNTIDLAVHSYNQVLDIANGIMMVEAAGAITAGAKVNSDADGKAVTATSTYVGIAMTDATAAGELVSIKL